MKFHAPEIVFGIGSLGEAGFAAGRLGARRPMIVTDPGIIEAGWVDELVGLLRESRLEPVVWSAVTPNPKDHEIRAAYSFYREQGADVLIAIGGGSCIDAAKGVAILSSNAGDILDYAGVDRVTQPIPPLLMIPSTSGTGADVSQFCIVSDTERHVKITIMGRALVPDISITDPRLLMTMPEQLNAATGLDALTHGIESFVSLAHNPLADIHALNAVGLVCHHLRATMTDPTEQHARSKMAQASLQAGLAFTNAILGATHAMSHQVGGLLDAPHGVVNGVLLPHVIRFNARATPERFVDLARSAGLSVDGLPGDEAAELLAAHVRAPRRRRGCAEGAACARGDRGGHPAPGPHHPRRRLPDHQPADRHRGPAGRALPGSALRPHDHPGPRSAAAPRTPRRPTWRRSPASARARGPTTAHTSAPTSACSARSGRWTHLPGAGPHRRGAPRPPGGGGPRGRRDHLDASWTILALSDGHLPRRPAALPRARPRRRTHRRPTTTCRRRYAASWARSGPVTRPAADDDGPWVRVPMTLEGRPVGSLVGLHGLTPTPEPGDLSVLRILANQAAVSLHTSEQYQAGVALHRRAQRLYDEATAQARDLEQRTAELRQARAPAGRWPASAS